MNPLRYLRLVFPALVFAGLAAAFTMRSNSTSARLTRIALLGIFLVSWPPVAWVVMWTLEAPYVDTLNPPFDAQAIVVLSGDFRPREAREPYLVPGPSTVTRCRRAAWLFHNWKQSDILVCAATVGVEPGNAEPAMEMSRLLQGWGVPKERILLETRGTSTYLQAVRAGELLRGRGISKVVVVTEAYHMARSLGSFRKTGMQAEASACGFRSFHGAYGVADFLPNPAAIGDIERAIREWTALAVYRLQGKI